MRFLPGHGRRKNTPGFDIVDCGFETPCHVWRLARDGRGYGFTAVAGKTVLVHRLVWAEAHGKIAPGVEIHHRCENTSCARLDHLSDQASHAAHMQLHGRLTIEQVRAIRRSPETGVALARRYGVSRSTVSKIRLGKTWAE